MEIESEQAQSERIESLEIIPDAKHLCWFYATDEERVSVVGQFLTEALIRRKQCLLIVSGDIKDQILAVLKESEHNVTRYLETEQIISVEPDEFYFGQAGFDIDVIIHRFGKALKAAGNQGWEGLTVVSDPSQVLSRASDGDWLSLEFRADFECSTKSCTMLCLYDQRLISGALLAGLIKAHPIIGLGKSIARNPFYITKTGLTS